ncbi:hypothetical protein Q0Z83_045830 [Actinoplanes sichuanensis]|nr:SAM-dependent methyltransferase [Actinoplanes sichuanensis]BEL06392.1 hypothetical protein Q0Z83_045830 [Actinoplanes sichuanensis]
MLVPRTDHQAERPLWDCTTCGEPWPCAVAKVELVEQYRDFPHGLAVLLGSFLVEAIDDWAAATSGPPADLYERFLGWSKPSSAPRRTRTGRPEIGIPHVPGRLDTTGPHSARVYDHWLGGKDNFAADRALGDAITQMMPGVRHMAAESRKFVNRIARDLAAKESLRQFLDIGAGLPAPPNLHETVQSIDPTTRIVYVDNDPLVLAHARALMTSHPDGRVTHLEADLRRPATILTATALHDTLDLTRPVGLTLIAILSLLPDADDPWACLGRLRDALPSGSCLALTHLTADLDADEVNAAATIATSAGMPWFPRTRDAVERFFGDWELLDPGIRTASAWRSDEPVDASEAATAGPASLESRDRLVDRHPWPSVVGCGVVARDVHGRCQHERDDHRDADQRADADHREQGGPPQHEHAVQDRPAQRRVGVGGGQQRLDVDLARVHARNDRPGTSRRPPATVRPRATMVIRPPTSDRPTAVPRPPSRAGPRTPL